VRYHRVVFLAGVAVGFIVGSRAGRERYDQIVKYTQKAVQSPPVQRAGQAVSGKATELSKAAAAKATSMSKSAAAQAPKAASNAARMARDQAASARGALRTSMPKVSVPRPGRRSDGSDPAAGGTQASVNGQGRHAATDGQA
jgi:cell division septum initiation protein DivIVA